MSQFFTLSEILPFVGEALPASMSKLAELAADWRSDPRRARMRWGKGGGYEYHVSLLPASVQASLGLSDPSQRLGGTVVPSSSGGVGTDVSLIEGVKNPSPVPSGHLLPQGEKESGSTNLQPLNTPSNALWSAFERLSKRQQDQAATRQNAVNAVHGMVNVSKACAIALVAKQIGVSNRTLWNWVKQTADICRTDRLAALASKRVGRTTLAPCDPHAWDYLVADYLRVEKPKFEVCYYRLTRAALEHGWAPVPSSKTLKRRLEREFPRAVTMLAREGREAVQRIYPHQTRSKAHFHWLQAINGDGHKFDVFVKWQDGSIARPMMVGFQDLYSGVILSHRIDKTENKECVRLAMADLVERWGIPEECWLDNGRSFASKWITGRMATRYRFKIKDEEPAGIMEQLGIKVHWATPYHGQAKPIERAWGDLCEEVSKHPQFAGAYTGKNTVSKPENYASKAIDEGVFRAVVAREIAAHNAKSGRRTATTKGRSFMATLEESLAHSDTLIRKATAAQRRMLLLAAEGVTARAPTGEIVLEGNRYWAEALPDYMGQKLIIRFDPQDLKAQVAVYSLDGRFICEAVNQGEAGFDDMDAAREHGKARKSYIKATKAVLDAQRRLGIEDVAAFSPSVEDEPLIESKVIKMVANGNGQIIPFRRQELD
jgi:putative transposase